MSTPEDNKYDEEAPFFEAEKNRERFVYFPLDPTEQQRPRRAENPEPLPMPRSRSNLGTGEKWIPGKPDPNATSFFKSGAFKGAISIIGYALGFLAAISLISFVIYQVFNFYSP